MTVGVKSREPTTKNVTASFTFITFFFCFFKSFCMCCLQKKVLFIYNIHLIWIVGFKYDGLDELMSIT